MSNSGTVANQSPAQGQPASGSVTAAPGAPAAQNASAGQSPRTPEAKLSRVAARKAWLESQPKPKLRGWLHGINTPLSIAGSVVLIAIAPTVGLKWACAIFGLTALLLFGNSAVYHLGHWGPKVHSVLRRIDHSNIFVLIAGTYTRLSAAILSPAQRDLVLSIVWIGAFVGVLLSAIWNTAPRWLYVPLYVLLGWVAIWFMPDFWRNGSPAIVVLLLVGGVAYTLGALAYGFRWPNPWPRYWGFHEFFHLGTIIGYWTHFAAVVIALELVATRL